MGAAIEESQEHVTDETSAMHPRLRSFIGTIIIILLVVTYAVVATAFASATLANSPWWVHLGYFVLSGLLWILPAMLIIKWMAGTKRQK